ncbi:ATP-grasp domain-containing protein, partial [Chloroflexota bacterium]
SRVLELMGNKIAARREMKNAGIPIVPGADAQVTALDEAKAFAIKMGYPVIIKPSGGGGGIGMVVANDETELRNALESAQALASTTFGLSDVYIEKYIRHPRHIEIQIMGDSQGNVIHFGERDCSIQRRYQKLIEEAPSPALTPELRKEMGEKAVRAAKWVNYEGAGTIEFLFSEGKFYFLEANTRIQVEHPVTEMVTGVDLVKEQILVASGQPLSISQDEVKMNGWAIECRINAEDPLRNFASSPGKITGYRSPGGFGIRLDSGVHNRHVIPSFYDPMIAKLIAWGKDRDEAIRRMRRALYEYIITGVKTNIPFHKAVMENPTFISGELGTHFIKRETTLLDDMKRIMERDKPIEERLSGIFVEKRKIAAISAVAAVTQTSHSDRQSDKSLS